MLIEQSNWRMAKAPAIFVGLLILLSTLSCKTRLNEKSENVTDYQLQDSIQPLKDVLFFIDGQLCQHLRKIYQDKNDNLWFGTNIYGLMRYDGNSLERFDRKSGHSFGRMTGFAEDKEGNLWICCSEGLFRYDGERFENFRPKDPTISYECWSMLIDKQGIIWLGTQGGLLRFDGQEFISVAIPKISLTDPQIILSADRIVSVVGDKQGNLWLGTDGFGILKYDGLNFTRYTTKEGLCDNTIHEMKFDSKGNLWIGTYYGGVSRFDGKHFENFTQEEKVKGEEVSAFYEDKSGNIWFAAENNGVYKYDGETFTNFNEKEGLITNGILSIYQDRQDRFWFGGWGGLFRYDAGRFTPVTKDGPWK